MKRREFMQSVIASGALAAIGSPEWLIAHPRASARRVARLDAGWRFHLGDAPGAEQPGFDDAAWEAAVLPHSARLEALVTGRKDSPEWQWQGTCWYRRTLRVDDAAAGDRILLKFDGAMNVADVWIDGKAAGSHPGGYLPFVLDITTHVSRGREHVLAVRLDNRDNPVTGPKPLEQLDFNMYHGLYRPVYLIRKHALHITDALLANLPASGGIFVTYPRVSASAATVRVKTHVRNDGRRARTFRVRLTLAGADGRVVARGDSARITLRPGAQSALTHDLEVARPALWSPVHPNLHTLQVDVIADGTTVDTEIARVGIRRIEIKPHSFSINGEQLFLRGTNRHQEYPYIGYALSDAAQYRDARKIKDAGFDYIRLSHYAHAPAFMDACDELGIVVMNCIPGWQYFNPDPAFVELQYRNCRDLIRRDRNHPCVVMWEVSLNESAMPPEFIVRTHAIAHEEYPGDQCFTAGWVKGYDVFIQARQHGGCHQERDSMCVVSEYGDWEYYAMTAGLNQHAWEQLTPAESNSRQLRWQGERALLQQAANFQEAHNDNRSTIAFADGLWVMYDYNRGYAPDIESSGCMDIFRLPKFSYYFFRSQRGPSYRLADAAGPMVFIASYWMPQSAPVVRVFSNCEEVALHLNGRQVGRKRAERGPRTAQLAHPPFEFDTGGFTPGVLEAVGYIAGTEAARHRVRTPELPAGLTIWVADAGRPPERGRPDALFCHAAIQDANGTVVADAWENVAFGVTGAGALAGANPYASDAGIASILLATSGSGGSVSVYGLAIVSTPAGTVVLSGGQGLGAGAPPHEVRITTDGSEPDASSPLYRGPIDSRGSVIRAALLAGGKVVATLTSDAPKYRIPASAPPEQQRTPFHG